MNFSLTIDEYLDLKQTCVVNVCGRQYLIMPITPFLYDKYTL